MLDQQLALVALNKIRQLGPVTIHRLLTKFKSAEKVFNQSSQALKSIPYINDNLVKLIQQADWKKSAELELKTAKDKQCQILTFDQPAYPDQLKKIDDPPPVIYMKGTLDSQDHSALAVVGSRRPTDYGKKVTRVLVKALVRHQLTIVSGLAYGIDYLAHQATLENNGRTIAVLAHGLDQIYPRAHTKMFDQIIRQGAVISEFPFGYPALAHNFPRRNRIISGLAQSVLVIEAKMRSGALITARWAAEQGRDVFAVPGSVFSVLSQGCHQLINDGAKLVTTAEDVLEEVILPKKHQEKRSSSLAVPSGTWSDLELAILNLLQEEAYHIDQLSVKLQKPINELFANLLTLEMKGVIIAQPGQYYQINY